MKTSTSSLSNKTYPRDTAGAAMTEKVPIVKTTDTIRVTKALVTEHSQDFDTLNYVYVLDSGNKLVGVVSIKHLLSAKQIDAEIKELVKGETVVSTHPYSHQEKASQLALKHNIKAIPVLDKDDTFLGVITSDKILSITHQELREDLLKLTGYTGNSNTEGNDNILEMPLKVALIHRLPWIVIGFLGGLLIAQTIGSFEATLEQNVAIAAFIPMMVYMSNAVGQQITAFVIRDSASGAAIKFSKYFSKQFWVVFIMGLLMGLSLFSFGFLIYKNLIVAAVLGFAMFATILSSIFTGLLIPFAFIKIKMDPANASGPIGTALQDFLSVLIYFTIASLLL